MCAADLSCCSFFERFSLLGLNRWVLHLPVPLYLFPPCFFQCFVPLFLLVDLYLFIFFKSSSPQHPSPQECHHPHCRRCGTGVNARSSLHWCSYGSLNLRWSINKSKLEIKSEICQETYCRHRHEMVLFRVLIIIRAWNPSLTPLRGVAKTMWSLCHLCCCWRGRRPSDKPCGQFPQRLHEASRQLHPRRVDNLFFLERFRTRQDILNIIIKSSWEKRRKSYNSQYA